MNDKNLVLLEGIITTEPTLKTPTPKSKVCNCIIVNKEYYTQKKTQKINASFFKLEFWNKLATTANQNLKIGDKISITSARLTQNRWLDSNGIPRKEIVIKVGHFKQLNKDKEVDR